MHVVVRGGLGNQMFQVAHGVQLAALFNVQPKFVHVTIRGDTARSWELSCFGITRTVVSPMRRLSLLAEFSLAQKYPLMPFLSSRVLTERRQPAQVNVVPHLVGGYWQGPGYFESVEAQVRELYKFPDVGSLLSLKREGPLVAIHVRRGDYVTSLKARKLHLVCDIDYYQRAWALMRSRVPNSRAVVFSDDIEWARQSLGLAGDVEFLEPSAGPSWVDMSRMSTCDHFIISNSTYSWWAAYLSQSSAEKQVVAPVYWFSGVETKSLGICPPEWVLI